MGREAHLPLFRPWYQESLKSASLEATPLVTRSPQNLTTFLASSLARSTLTVCLPSKRERADTGLPQVGHDLTGLVRARR